MTKRKAKVKFALLAIIAAIGILLTCFSFRIPFTTIRYNGFANAIRLGLDIKGGVLAVYEASVEDDQVDEFDSRLNATISRLEQFLADEDYSEAVVYKQGTNKIAIEVPDVDDPQAIFDIIGQPASLEISREGSSLPALTGDDIKSAKAYYQQTSETSTAQWGVSIEFTASGTTKFYDLTNEAYNDSENNTVDIYIGGTLFSSPTVSDGPISGGSTFITGGGSNGDGTMSQEEAEEYATKILSGTFSTKLTLVSNSVVSATLGKEALTYGIIAGAIGLLLIFIFMIVCYGVMGVLADFALIFYLIIYAFVLQAVPLVQLTLPGIAGIILSLGMAVDANVIVFERIKEEYASGKKIHMSVNSGFKNAFSAILDSNVTTIIASVVLYILGTSTIKGFAITLFFGILISMFTSLVVTRSLLKTYLPINSTNPKWYKLKRDKDIVISGGDK